MNKTIEAIKKYIRTRCWHEWDLISSFDKKMQNDHERPIKVIQYKCIKCGVVNSKNYWKDLIWI